MTHLSFLLNFILLILKILAGMLRKQQKISSKLCFAVLKDKCRSLTLNLQIALKISIFSGPCRMCWVVFFLTSLLQFKQHYSLARKQNWNSLRLTMINPHPKVHQGFRGSWRVKSPPPCCSSQDASTFSF